MTYVIINLGIIAILYFGGRQVDAGRLTQGQIIALINYMSQILTELVKLANLIILLSRAMASLSRVNTIFEQKPSISAEGTLLEIPDPSCGNIPAVAFENVGFTYAGANPRLCRVFLSPLCQGKPSVLSEEPAPVNLHWQASSPALRQHRRNHPAVRTGYPPAGARFHMPAYRYRPPESRLILRLPAQEYAVGKTGRL